MFNQIRFMKNHVIQTPAPNLEDFSPAKRIRRALSPEAGDIWYLLNSESAYTLRASSFIEGAIAAYILDNGRCVVASTTGDRRSAYTPEWPAFLEKHGIYDLDAWIDGGNALALSLCLDSVLVGSLEHRGTAEARAKLIDSDRDLLRWVQNRERERGIQRYSLQKKAQRRADEMRVRHLNLIDAQTQS